jgi:hypothetical protein
VRCHRCFRGGPQQRRHAIALAEEGGEGIPAQEYACELPRLDTMSVNDLHPRMFTILRNLDCDTNIGLTDGDFRDIQAIVT